MLSQPRTTSSSLPLCRAPLSTLLQVSTAASIRRARARCRCVDSVLALVQRDVVVHEGSHAGAAGDALLRVGKALAARCRSGSESGMPLRLRSRSHAATVSKVLSSVDCEMTPKTMCMLGLCGTSTACATFSSARRARNAAVRTYLRWPRLRGEDEAAADGPAASPSAVSRLRV